MYERKLTDYLPPAIKDVRELKSIFAAEQPEIAALWQTVDDVFCDQFIADATVAGVSRWEKILGIVPRATLTLDERKFTIITKLTEQLPFTLTTLKNQLLSLCGEDGCTVLLDHNNYKLTVKIALTAANNFDDTVRFLNRVVPANIVVQVELLYNTYAILSRFTHSFLHGYTHDQLRKEVFS